MKKGREFVWSMWECVNRIVCTPCWRSMGRACDSEPASSAIASLINRQVIRQSMLSPPKPPKTAMFILPSRILTSLRSIRQGGEQLLTGGKREGTANEKTSKRRRYLRAVLGSGADLDLVRGH